MLLAIDWTRGMIAEARNLNVKLGVAMQLVTAGIIEADISVAMLLMDEDSCRE